MIYDIKQESVQACYEFVRISSDALKKKILLYKNTFENPDEFFSDKGDLDDIPLRILFVDNFNNGHF